MNFIIQVSRHKETICYCVKTLATTYSLIWFDIGNYEIHSFIRKYTEDVPKKEADTLCL